MEVTCWSQSLNNSCYAVRDLGDKSLWIFFLGGGTRIVVRSLARSRLQTSLTVIICVPASFPRVNSVAVVRQRRECKGASCSQTYEDSPSRRSCRHTPSSRHTARTWGYTASSHCGRRTAPGCSAALEQDKKPRGAVKPTPDEGETRRGPFVRDANILDAAGAAADESNRCRR